MRNTAPSTRWSPRGLLALLSPVRPRAHSDRIDVRRGDRPYELVVYDAALRPGPGKRERTVAPPDEPTRASA